MENSNISGPYGELFAFIKENEKCSEMFFYSKKMVLIVIAASMLIKTALDNKNLKDEEIERFGDLIHLLNISCNNGCCIGGITKYVKTQSYSLEEYFRNATEIIGDEIIFVEDILRYFLENIDLQNVNFSNPNIKNDLKATFEKSKEMNKKYCNRLLIKNRNYLNFSELEDFTEEFRKFVLENKIILKAE